MTAEPAWQLIADYWHYWRPFEASYGFRPGVDPTTWPAIHEPVPSVTFDLDRPVGPVTDRADMLQQVLLRAWTQQCDESAVLVALSWNHDGYLFRPHRQAVSSAAEWMVSPYPNGDYSIFATPDLRDGVFGHPWESTLCVFGAESVQSVAAALAERFEVLRSRSA